MPVRVGLHPGGHHFSYLDTDSDVPIRFTPSTTNPGGWVVVVGAARADGGGRATRWESAGSAHASDHDQTHVAGSGADGERVVEEAAAPAGGRVTTASTAASSSAAASSAASAGSFAGERRPPPIDGILFLTSSDVGVYEERVRRAGEGLVADVAGFGSLNARALQTLLDGGLLNDDIINALGHVVTERTDAAALSSFFLDSLLGAPKAEPTVDIHAACRCTLHLPSRPLFLIPVNTRGEGGALGHWSLIAVRRDTNTIVYYDSLHPLEPSPRVSAAIDALPLWLQAYECSHAPRHFTVTQAPRDVMPSQPNVTDCGIFVLAAMACLARRQRPAEHVASTDGKRIRRSFLIRLLSK